ncbi:glycosyl hydrolase family 18 protein [Planomonospora venezuelensis]|uniref:chitinase n=1 Tax=Planomonospora venezuelensis TaxID=1999 RepID=A0A841D6E7_PLAVE|nr:glycosyl hydrolase family 18 protein [Planomonospora venezuelensis]MBB5966212.1 chitinase [Planomonospora venezuelensis]
MRRITLGSLIAATALLVPLGLGAAEAATPATATYATDSDWGSGFQGKVTVKAGSTPLTSWKVEFDVPSGTSISSAWDAEMAKSGNHYTFTNKSWNGSVAAGASLSFGFVGAPGGLKSLSNCKLNGASCSGTGNPDPTPTPTVTPTATPTPTPTPTVTPTATPTPTVDPDPSGKKVVGYFTNWGVYGRNFHVKNLVTNGSAAKLTHILYAFGNTTGGKCTIGDSYADYDKAYTADQSVDGVADTWDQPLRGNFNQLRKLKKAYPNIKVIWSFGGWTWSGGFTQAAANPAAFAQSCHDLVEDPRWADVFDGIDIDWEYPNACGLSCDTSGPNAFKNLISALRAKFGSSALITAAITADGTDGGKIDAADYAGAISNLNWLMPMTYDYMGAWDAKGPTAPHSALTSYTGIPKAGFYSDAAIQKLKAKGVPASKLLLGIGFYGRGWTGVTQAAPGGTATGPAPGTYEQGIEDYKVLKTKCPATGTIAGTAYAFCNGQWWSYDTPATITGKMDYAKKQGLGGAFFWETSGDTANGELITAMANGLK